MKLIIKNRSGLLLLRPSHKCLRVARTEKGVKWIEQHISGSERQLQSREVHVPPGSHEIERIANPFFHGGEPWLVLKGSRIGAAEAYLKRLAAETQGTSDAVCLVTETPAPVVLAPAMVAKAA